MLANELSFLCIWFATLNSCSRYRFRFKGQMNNVRLANLLSDDRKLCNNEIASWYFTIVPALYMELFSFDQ